MPRVLGAATVLGGTTALGFGVASAQAQFDSRYDVDRSVQLSGEAESRGFAVPGSMTEPANGLKRESEEWWKSGLALAVSGGIAVVGGVTALATRGKPAAIASGVAGAAALAAGVSGVKVASDYSSFNRHTEVLSAASSSRLEPEETTPDSGAYEPPSMRPAPSADVPFHDPAPTVSGWDRHQDMTRALTEAMISSPTVEGFALQLGQADEVTRSDEQAVRRAVLGEATGLTIATGDDATWRDVAAALDISGDGTVDATEQTPSDEADALGTYAAYREEAVDSGRDPARTMTQVLYAMANGEVGTDSVERGQSALMARQLEGLAAEELGSRPLAMEDVVGALDSRVDAILASSEAPVTV